MVEKPISAHKADAERLIAAHSRKPRLVFAGMFQLRSEPRYLKIRKLIQDGELGPIVRMNWIMTDWFRTEAYYASGGWRATWKGEGGGVLLNQCLHNLDVMQWLLGMPARVRGFCQLGRFHDIEVEDNVSAYLEWSNGATGIFVTSTGESPGTNRFEIVGTRGKLVLEKEKSCSPATSRTCSNTAELQDSALADLKFGMLKFRSITQRISTPCSCRICECHSERRALIAPGEEGIHSVELANVILSSLLGKPSSCRWTARPTRSSCSSSFPSHAMKRKSWKFQTKTYQVIRPLRS
jgi:predicted dehydrogenase